MIAHRLSTVMDADVILLLENGTVVEQGSHAELMANPDSRYVELWRKQSAAAEDRTTDIKKEDDEGNTDKSLEEKDSIPQ